MGNSIFDSDVIFKFISDLGLTNFFRRTVLRHIMSILIAVFMSGYKGKVPQMSGVSPGHRFLGVRPGYCIVSVYVNEFPALVSADNSGVIPNLSGTGMQLVTGIAHQYQNPANDFSIL